MKETKKENVKEEEKKEKQNVEINKNGSLVELMENKLNILGKQLYEENDIQKQENKLDENENSLEKKNNDNYSSGPILKLLIEKSQNKIEEKSEDEN